MASSSIGPDGGSLSFTSVPQPLKDIGRDDTRMKAWLAADHTPEAIQVFPEIAAVMMTALCWWTKIDEDLAWVLAVVVPLPGQTLNAAHHAMYHSVINLSTKLDLIRAALRLGYPDEIQTEFEGIAKSVRKGSGERLQIAHGQWVVSKELFPKGIILRQRLDFRGLAPVGYTKKDFEQICSRASQLCDRLEDFRKRAGRARHKSP